MTRIVLYVYGYNVSGINGKSLKQIEQGVFSWMYKSLKAGKADMSPIRTEATF